MGIRQSERELEMRLVLEQKERSARARLQISRDHAEVGGTSMKLAWTGVANALMPGIVAGLPSVRLLIVHRMRSLGLVRAK